jgi:hypothetical protein
VTRCCSAAVDGCTIIMGSMNPTLLRRGIGACRCVQTHAAVGCGTRQALRIAGIGVGPLSSAASRRYTCVIAERRVRSHCAR